MERSVSTREEREGFPLLGATVAPVVDDAAQGGAWQMIELTVAPGGRSPLHTLSVDKAFYVLEGAITLVVGDATRPAGAGDAARIPAGTPHNYANEGDAPARLLVVASGVGHVEFLRGMSRLAAAGPPDATRVEALADEFGVRLLAAAGR